MPAAPDDLDVVLLAYQQILPRLAQGLFVSAQLLRRQALRLLAFDQSSSFRGGAGEQTSRGKDHDLRAPAEIKQLIAAIAPRHPRAKLLRRGSDGSLRRWELG